MLRPSRLHDQLIEFAGQYSQWSDLRHLGVMCWMMVGLIAEGKVNLTKWIDHVCTKAQIAQSTQRRLSRWVNNPRINPAKLYSPVVKAVFANWKDAEIYLSFDTSMLWDEYCIIRICVVHLGRAIPVGWRVLKHKSSSVKIDTYQDLLTEPTTLQTFREYGFRFTIEENFLDDKSSGFNLEDSKLRSAPALSRLCLVLAMTTLFLTAQGVEVVTSGHRRRCDPHWSRGASYLKIGWSWVKQAINKGWDLISFVSFTSNIDPDPVKASQSQHHHKTYRIEFKATTHIWAN
jgi:hypothetical protein